MDQVHSSLTTRTDSSTGKSETPANKFSLLEHISGYGRELFISNFLTFISTSEAYVPFVKEAFKSLGLPLSFTKVIREFKHTDLTFVDEDGNILLVVENKAGDKASRQQLEKYIAGEEIKNAGRHILISPLEVDSYVAKAANWEFISYEKLANALMDAFKKDPDSHHTFEYEFLLLVIEYMAALSNEATTAVDSVKSDTKIQDIHTVIHAELMCYNDKKKNLRRRFLGYAGICSMLNKKLTIVGSGISANLSKGMMGMPIVEIKTELGDFDFYCQFQNDHLSLGFCQMSSSSKVKMNKTEKSQYLQSIWETSFNGTENIKTICDTVNGMYSEYPELKHLNIKDIQRGYITDKYEMPMLHLDKKCDMTVDRLTDIMASIAQGAEKLMKVSK